MKINSQNKLLDPSVPGSRHKKNWAGILVLILSLCFIGYGIWNGEIATVYQKAAAICLECIGIG